MDPDSGASEAEKPARKQQEERGERQENTKLWVREEWSVMRILQVLMHTGIEEEAEESGAWCIMGTPPAV